MQIGEQIKKLRKLRSISLTKLSEDSGVQIATLSRIEHGKMTGTLASHISIAAALGIELIDLYRDIAQNPEHTHPEEILEVVKSPDGKIIKEVLSRHLASRKMLPVMISFAAKTTGTPDTFASGSERFLYVLAGQIDLNINAQKISLQPGMSLLFNSGRTHTISNPADEPAKLLSITTPSDL